MNLVFALSAFPFGKLSDRISHTRLLFLGLAVLIFADLFLALGTSWTALLPGIVLWGLHMGMRPKACFPPWLQRLPWC